MTIYRVFWSVPVDASPGALNGIPSYSARHKEMQHFFDTEDRAKTFIDELNKAAAFVGVYIYPLMQKIEVEGTGENDLTF